MADSTLYLSEFWEKHYLDEYIPEGGSKIKFITGRPGSGKTWFLDHFRNAAEKSNYITVSLSAGSTWLHDFREVFLAIAARCDMDGILRGCSEKIIREMGYSPEEIPSGQTFMDMLSGRGAADPMSRREIRDLLRKFFLGNPMMDNNFALALSLLTGSILGYPVLEPPDRSLIQAWLSGDRTLKLSQLRSVGITDKVNKYNARHMLRSLAEAIHLAGFRGLVITIDDLEILQDKAGSEEIRYTKLRREDTYESIRQLIDDIDSMRFIMILYGFDRSMIDLENTGLKSYQALWMRIQNEIVSARFNRFVDIADMDRLALQVMTAEDVKAMASAMGAGEPDDKTAQEILAKARVSGIGLPMLVKEEVLHG
ncbi:MAG: DUF2791 family P-loop domain-containing protein [Clostridium sp.]|nr:DUF2791 family P-loop domain-containing protein [Clostridium sp.]